MPSRYHPTLVALHWLLAALILMALAAGTLVLADTPNATPGKLDALRIHAIMGITIGVLMVIRLVVRQTTRHPAPATTGIALADRLAPLAHWALYALVLGMVASGITMSIQSGLGEAMFGAGVLPESFEIFAARAVHGALASLLILTIALHILAALYHIGVRRDGLLRRMWFGAR